MRKWVLYGVGSLVCLLLLTDLIPRFLAPTHRINRESYDFLRGGMTEEEVEEILGVPAGNYNTVHVSEFPCLSGLQLPKPKVCGQITAVTVWKEWKGNDAIVEIGFDSGGKLIFGFYRPVFRPDESFLEKLHRWFSL
jgi:hypothetical protein